MFPPLKECVKNARKRAPRKQGEEGSGFELIETMKKMKEQFKNKKIKSSLHNEQLHISLNAALRLPSPRALRVPHAQGGSVSVFIRLSKMQSGQQSFGEDPRRCFDY